MPSTQHWDGAECPSCRQLTPVLPRVDPHIELAAAAGEPAFVEARCLYCGALNRFERDLLLAFDVPRPIEYPEG